MKNYIILTNNVNMKNEYILFFNLWFLRKLFLNIKISKLILRLLRLSYNKI